MEYTISIGTDFNHKKTIKTIIDTEGDSHDYSSMYVTPKMHHTIITTKDGYKLALNPYNNIAYRIRGEYYND